MRVVLRMADGGEEVREVAAVDLGVGDWKLEVTAGSDPLRVHLHVPGAGRDFCSFVVHHRAANTMTVEVKPNGAAGEAAL